MELTGEMNDASRSHDGPRGGDLSYLVELISRLGSTAAHVSDRDGRRVGLDPNVKIHFPRKMSVERSNKYTTIASSKRMKFIY